MLLHDSEALTRFEDNFVVIPIEPEEVWIGANTVLLKRVAMPVPCSGCLPA
jgi:hypothetical protein